MYDFWWTEKHNCDLRALNLNIFPLEMFIMILGACVSRAPDGEDTLYANRFSLDTHTYCLLINILK